MASHALNGATLPLTLPERVVSLRAARGLTQAELAVLVGVSTAMVNRWERGHARPRSAHLALLERIERFGSVSVGGPASPALPAPVSSFVGRDADLESLGDLVLRSRLLTLTGPGGAGKTRLALEVARRAVERFAHGVILVELAGLTDPGLLDGVVAAAAGVTHQAGLLPRDALMHRWRDRRLLLVLDNCEHLLQGVAELSAALLRACPGVQILATSRESLGIVGEVIRLVAPLSLPPADVSTVQGIAASEAVHLFVQRASARSPGFAMSEDNAAAIGALCRRLDGLPLALELAAGWARVLAPAQIAASLGERFPLVRTESCDVVSRHRTLEATMDWSYALLDPAERRVFARLAVFNGGFNADALEAVCAGGTGEGEAPLRLLDRLVNKSLVNVIYRGAQPRFWLLETIRAYALVQLQAEGGEPAVRQRHADHFLDLAEQLAPQLEGPQQREMLERLVQDHDNLRAALGWLECRDDGTPFARLAAALIAFYETRGHLVEGRATLERALARVPADAPVRLAVLLGVGRLAYRQNDFAVAQARVAECLPLAQRSTDRQRSLHVLHLLGIVTFAAGDRRAGRAHVEAALAIARELGEVRLCARLLSNLGLMASDHGDFAEASARFDGAQAIAAENGFVGDAAIVLHCAGHTARRQGDAEEARARHIAGLALFVELGSRQAIAECLAGLAMVAGCWARPELAARLLGAAAAQFEAAAGGLSSSYRVEHAATVAHVRATLGDHGYMREWTAGAALSLDEAVAAALAMSQETLDLLRPPLPRERGRAAAPSAPSLSPREREVLRLLAAGATNREIADKLALSVRTVEHHLLNVYAKTGTRGRADATAYALRHALIVF